MGLVIILVTTVLLAGLLAPQNVQTLLKSEGGPIEWATVAGYVAALVYIIIRRLYGPAKWIFWLTVLLLMRELDFDTRFTDGKITKFDFFRSPDVPLVQEIYAIALLGVFFFVVYKVVTTYARNFLDEIADRSQIAMAAMLAIGSAGFSKLIDGPKRKAGYLGIDPSEQSILVFQLLEETLELAIPFLIIVALSHYYQRTLSSPGPLADGRQH
ncbi:MAG: hypothetical protein B7Y80_14400 [Hyphomicrobium sp. 32-62-53]|nr:MAG: hypothetical protein B7Z29_16075 [Hyphomicrobium sp. 12-62-95]OYX98680.1 MAG: hypothetical protein B7Y80_14400 [Hyphomicrobium sp. 32-62-53]